MHRGGETLPLPLPVEPHQGPGRSGEPVVEGGQEQFWIKVQGQTCRLLGPIDGRCWGRREGARRPCRSSWAGLVSCRRWQRQLGSTLNRLLDMRAPDALRRGTPAIPMEHVASRQGRWLGSCRHESRILVFCKHISSLWLSTSSQRR